MDEQIKPTAPAAIHTGQKRPFNQHRGPRPLGAGRGGPGRGGKGGRGKLRREGPRPHQAHPVREISEQGSNPDEKPIPPLEAGNIRIIPLGGVEEIGRNMTAVEFNDDIVIIDCGFQFKEDDTPGIDYILPNTKYLEDRRDKIRAMFITHGHLDHIGGIPYIIDRIGYPEIYTRKLTSLMIRKRQEEFPNLKPLTVHEVEQEDTVYPMVAAGAALHDMIRRPSPIVETAEDE